MTSLKFELTLYLSRVRHTINRRAQTSEQNKPFKLVTSTRSVAVKRNDNNKHLKKYDL